MSTIKLTTATGTNASRIGETYGSYEGVTWRNSVDRCDAEGEGRVFLDCEDDETAEMIESELENDDSVTAYGRA